MQYIAAACLFMALVAPWIAAEQDHLSQNPLLSERQKRTERRAIMVVCYIGAICAYIAGRLV